MLKRLAEFEYRSIPKNKNTKMSDETFVEYDKIREKI